VVQILASIVFFVVFVELFLALLLYLIVTTRDFIKTGKKSKKEKEQPHE